MNLSQNAVDHTREGDAVELGSRARRTAACASGCATPARACPSTSSERIFERFVARRRRAARRGRRPRARHHPRDRRGPRRPGRARQPPGRRAPASPSSSRPSHPRRWAPREPHPDRRGRAAARLVPGEGPARERLRDDRRRGRREGRAAMARDDEFDLLVLDLGLPGKDGTEVLRELRAGGPAHAGDHPHRARRRERQGRAASRAARTTT